RPTKLATVIGALSANSSQWKVPRLVSIAAVSGPLPGMSLVYSARSAAVGGRTVLSPGAGVSATPGGLPGSLPTGSGFMSSPVGLAPVAEPLGLSALGLGSSWVFLQATISVTSRRAVHVL